MLKEQKDQNSRINQALRLNADAINALTLRTENIEKLLPKDGGKSGGAPDSPSENGPRSRELYDSLKKEIP